jgi:hypothetical protein
MSKQEELAYCVVEDLNKHIDDSLHVDHKIITNLFDALYYASMQSEEGQSIIFTVTYINPNQVETNIKSQSIDRWNYIRFERPIPLNIKALVKLSKAADPWSSSIAVYHDENSKLFIYGLIDQAIHSQRYINHETDKEPEQAGRFQAAIRGIGNISVTTGYRIIAVLRQDAIITRFTDVLKFGPVSDFLVKKAELFVDDVKFFLTEKYPSHSVGKFEPLIYNLWRDTVSRLLIQIRNYHHGGAILISDENNGLSIKYPLLYNRLRKAMFNLIKNTIHIKINSDLIATKKVDFDENCYKRIEKATISKKEALNELKGAIRFVAAHSCVDGLILLNTNLVESGFGVVIENVNPPEIVYMSRRNTLDLISRPSDELGTRHRSMMSYCWENPESLGFVVSQDGDIRVMLRQNNKLIMWDNIQTQKYLKEID